MWLPHDVSPFSGKTAVESEDEELARAVAASLEENKVAGESDATDDKTNPEEEKEPSLSVKIDHILYVIITN